MHRLGSLCNGYFGGGLGKGNGDLVSAALSMLPLCGMKSTLLPTMLVDL